LARVSTDAGDGDDSDSDRDVPWAVIKVRSETEIIRCLDPRFFVEDFDPVTKILDNLPELGRSSFSLSAAGEAGGRGGKNNADGGSGSVSPSSSSSSAVAAAALGAAAEACDEYLEHQLRDMDVARLAVTTQIASMVQEDYAALVGGMRQVQAVDLDLARAGVQISNGRRGLQRSLARSTGPVLRLIETGRRRDRLRLVEAVTASCLKAVAEEGRVEGDLAAGRFTQAVATAELLAETVAGDEQLSSVAVLGGVRDRAENILATVKTRAELAVSELCQTFSPEAYGGIVEAFLLLEDRGALRPPPPPPTSTEPLIPAAPTASRAPPGEEGEVGPTAGEHGDGDDDAGAAGVAVEATSAGEGEKPPERRKRQWISQFTVNHE
ncbi:unnamed protein product, partial [Ectocarpus sp. 8 AP-2014]